MAGTVYADQGQLPPSMIVLVGVHLLEMFAWLSSKTIDEHPIARHRIGLRKKIDWFGRFRALP